MIRVGPTMTRFFLWRIPHFWEWKKNGRNDEIKETISLLGL